MKRRLRPKPDICLSTLRSLLKCAVLAGATALASCASTSFVSTWKAPDAQSLKGEGSKVAAVVMTQNDYQSGRIQSHDQALAAFQRNLERESKRFQENVRPQEVDKATNDYFAQRRSQERRAKGLQE